MGVLALIQAMKYFFKTRYREPKTYSKGSEDPKQGTCQGTAAPETRQQITTVLIKKQKRKGHRIKGGVTNHQEEHEVSVCAVRG